MLFYHLTVVGIRWGEPIWRFEFLPHHMANHSTKLQSTHLVHHKMLLIDVGPNNSWQGISDICNNGHVLGTSH
jgi:hypothetical protein